MSLIVNYENIDYDLPLTDEVKATATSVSMFIPIGKYGSKSDSYCFVPFVKASTRINKIYVEELTIPDIGTWSRSTSVTYELTELGITIALYGTGYTGSCYLRLTIEYK